eukprot:symbB.v1.2.000492.t1/scaffold11.1/size528188/41
MGAGEPCGEAQLGQSLDEGTTDQRVHAHPLGWSVTFSDFRWKVDQEQVPVALHAQISAWFAPTFSDAPGPASGFLRL